MRFRRILTLTGCLLACLWLAAQASASLKMYMGAAEDEGRNSDPAVAMAKMSLAKAAGFDAVRVTAIWSPGQNLVPADQLAALQAISAAGDFNGIRVLATIMPKGSSTTPLTATARGQFARFATDLARRAPGIREYIVGNEPNLNRYWLPQFGPDGSNAAATSYVALLARTYDALKAVDKNLFVIGGSVSPRGSDNPKLARQTHSPAGFIAGMGDAYRLSGRAKPIMDGFAMHPYGENSSTPPTLQHPGSTTIGLADYPKLVALLGQAFDGTAQLGSKLPIVYDEYGVDSTTPAAKRGLYHGTEPRTTKPVPEWVQSGYYNQALMMAACQPTVRGFLIFHVTDETDYDRWQSGVYYPDGTPKSTLDVVRRSMARVRSRNVECALPEPAPPIGGTTATGRRRADGWLLLKASG